MVTGIVVWPGNLDERNEFLAIVRATCIRCAILTDPNETCPEHAPNTVLGTYTVAQLRLLIGQKHDPFWHGLADRSAPVDVCPN
jgi:hypothetical protein